MKKVFLSLTAALLLSCAAAYTVPASSAAAPVGTFEYYMETGEFKCQLENGFYYDISEEPAGKSAVIRYYSGTESKVTVPENLGGMPVTVIDFFSGPNLDIITEISLPKSIKADDKTYSSMAALKNLSAVTVVEDNPELASRGGVLFTKDFSILASYPLAKPDTAYTEPDTVKKSYGVSGNPFIKEVTFSSNSEYTETSNCAHTNIEKVIIPSNVRKISAGAFEYCTNLKEIHWGGRETTIGISAFDNCISLQEVTLPKTVTLLEPFAFHGCTGLKNIKLPNGLKSIGAHAFYYCTSLKHITVPDSVLKIGYSAFEKTGINKIKKAPYLKKKAHKYVTGDVRYTYSAKVKLTKGKETKQYSAEDITGFNPGKKAITIKKGEKVLLKPVVNIKKGYGNLKRYGRGKIGKKQSGTPEPIILSYSSGNKKVVTVSKKGSIKGVKKGTAKICITLRTTGKKCYVKVIVK